MVISLPWHTGRQIGVIVRLEAMGMVVVVDMKYILCTVLLGNKSSKCVFKVER